MLNTWPANLALIHVADFACGALLDSRSPRGNDYSMGIGSYGHWAGTPCLSQPGLTEKPERLSYLERLGRNCPTVFIRYRMNG